MSKSICIFSDGTGQAGGANPVNWTSVYRLFVNTREPETAGQNFDQIAFYDPGLGSDPDQEEEPSLVSGLSKWIAQALGAGITRNIIDCYTAVLLTYEPGDRVFLFGFSRGAYTARSVGGALGLCGVPPGLPKLTRWQDMRARLGDPAVRAIAEEAVVQVYMTYNDKVLRAQKAESFRSKYGSRPLPPFFIGVWDTVRALGWQVTDIATFGRHRFHDSELNPRVDHGRQALAIDENRKVFSPEIWDQSKLTAANKDQIKQIWLAGCHSDVGGGFGLRMGLTDLAMKWMVDEAMAARDRVPNALRSPDFGGLKVNSNLLNELNLDQLGVQHDPRASLTGKLWWPGSRATYVAAPELAGKAITQVILPQRFEADAVPIDDAMEPYRPHALRDHPDYGSYYVETGRPVTGPSGGGG